MEDNSIQMDEILKSLFHLSNKPIINLINGIFDTDYSTDIRVEYSENEFVKSSPGFKYATIIADCFLTVTSNSVKKEYHLEFQLKKDKAMALRMYEYAFMKAASNAYSTNQTQKITFPEQAAIFIEEEVSLEENLCLTLEIKSKETKYDVPIYKIWIQDVSNLITRKLFPFLVLIPFSFRRELDKLNKKGNNKDSDKIKEKTLQLMETYHEVATLLFALYKDEEFTFNDLKIVYNALNHITKHIFNKYDVADIINKEVEKMLDTLWNPELERNLTLNVYRNEIITNLVDEAFDFNEDEVRKKLNNINDEKRLRKLFKLSGRVDNIETFLNRI